MTATWVALGGRRHYDANGSVASGFQPLAEYGIAAHRRTQQFRVVYLNNHDGDTDDADMKTPSKAEEHTFDVAQLNLEDNQEVDLAEDRG